MVHALSITNFNALNLREHDGFGCRKGEVILIDSDVSISHSDSLILVKNLFSHFSYNYMFLFIKMYVLEFISNKDQFIYNHVINSLAVFKIY